MINSTAFSPISRLIPSRLLPHWLYLLVVGLALVSCESAYYGVWERMGVYKRDLLVDRVEDAQDAQQAASEEFASALEQFTSVVNVEPSQLSVTYERLNASFENAESRAAQVSERINAVEDVSEDLFSEWRSEIDLISNANLRSASARQLSSSEVRYADLIRSMRRAEARMEPVLTTFRDHVLFLKHNLNAQAVSALRTELDSIESNVGQLIEEMQASIAESQAFIDEMQLI